jgi:hypothetical protein
MTDPDPDWQNLDYIFYRLNRLDHPLYDIIDSREARLDAFERALSTGEIPLRGWRVEADGLSGPERIERKLKTFTPEIYVFANRVELFKDYGPNIPKLGFAVFENVQADRTRLEEFLLEAVDPPEKPAPDKVHTPGEMLSPALGGTSQAPCEAVSGADESSPKNGNNQTLPGAIARDFEEGFRIGASELGQSAIAAQVRKPLPAARENELRTFLVDWARKQKALSKPNNDEAAHAAAEEYFNARITRERVRKNRAEAGCNGQKGRPRKSAKK